MAYRRRTMRYSTGRRSSFSSRGRGTGRRRTRTRRAREVRLVLQAPRGIMPRIVTTGQGVRYRRRRRF